MNPIEIAIKMLEREHVRWNQWALFFFGSIMTVFIVWGKIQNDVPLKYAFFMASFLSVIWSVSALSIRASTYAWRETIEYLEEDKIEEKPFKIYKIILEKKNQICDFISVFKFWHLKFFSVTGMLVIMGFIFSIFFGFLAIKYPTKPPQKEIEVPKSMKKSMSNKPMHRTQKAPVNSDIS